jgi:hypothetical protein
MLDDPQVRSIDSSPSRLQSIITAIIVRDFDISNGLDITLHNKCEERTSPVLLELETEEEILGDLSKRGG